MKKRKTSKKTSGASGNMLHGVPHGKRIAKTGRLSKTQKRPSTMFGGILTGQERKRVFEEAGKIVGGEKKISDTGAKLKPYILQAIARMGKQW